MAEQLTADFYGRKSTKDDGRSIAGQEQDYRADCAENDLLVGRTFADADRSASRYARKPRDDYQQLIAFIRSGSCQMVSLWESSRGSRDLADWVTFIDLCRKTGTLIRIISHDRTYDVRKRRDWRTLAEEGVNSADESEIIAERSRRGKRVGAARGRPAGKLLYGYTREYDDRGKYVRQYEHPEQAPIVKEVIHSLAARQSCRGIALRLNRRGITGPGGSPWDEHHVRRMGLNPAYIGRRIHQRVDVGPADWPALVDESVFLTAQAILRDPARRTQRGSGLTHWLSGAVRCGGCQVGFLISSQRKGGKDRRLRYYMYKCKRCGNVTAGAPALEAAVEEALKARLAMDDAADLFVAPANADELRAAEAEAASLDQQLKEHYAAAAHPDPAKRLSAQGLVTVEALLLPQIAEAQAKVDRLSLPAELADLQGLDIVAVWNDLPPALKRTVARTAADLRLSPGRRSGPKFDRSRLHSSRWRGDTKTWGEIINE